MNTLLASPVRRCRVPAYPDKRQVVVDPELLKRHVPPGWLSNWEIAALASTLLAAGATGCGHSPPPAAHSARAAAVWVASLGAPSRASFQKETRDESVTWGVVLPAAVLSEDEALQIIVEELREYGLRLPQRNVELPTVIISGKELQSGFDWIEGKQSTRLVDARAPLIVDLFDSQRGIAIEYVGREDCLRFGGDFAGWLPGSGADAAACVAKEVGQQANGIWFGAFYDAEPGSKAAERLRQQVKDFIDWLKAQGVI